MLCLIVVLVHGFEKRSSRTGDGFDSHPLDSSPNFNFSLFLWTRLTVALNQIQEGRVKEIAWMSSVCAATGDSDGITWGVFNSRNSSAPPKSIVGTYPLQKESPNSHAMMRHTINIAKYVLFDRKCLSNLYYTGKTRGRGGGGGGGKVNFHALSPCTQLLSARLR